MTDHKDLIERLAWPVNPNDPEGEVTLTAWVLELCAEARDALESAQLERDTIWAEATAAAYGAAADIAHEGALATEDDGVAAWVRDRIKAQTPQSARDWLAEREAEAYRKGQEDMRELAAKSCKNDDFAGDDKIGPGAWASALIRTLPIKEKGDG